MDDEEGAELLLGELSPERRLPLLAPVTAQPSRLQSTWSARRYPSGPRR